MASAGRTVYIAGAGIAGLTLALALAKFGASVVVLERHPSVTEAGAGVQISPNARRVLMQLGLDKQVTAQSLEPEGIDVYPLGTERPLITLALGETVRARYGVPYAVMHRGDLAELLHRACRRFANVDIALGISSFSVEDSTRGLAVTAEQDSGTRGGRAFAFVGADGVHSQTRTAVLSGPPASPSSTVAWRSMIGTDKLEGHLALNRTSLLLAPGCHAVCYPMPHRRAVNVALFANAATTDGADSRPTLPPRAARSDRFAAIMGAAGTTWTYWPLATVETPSWHTGNVGLVGDAAHAMLPFQAQGAAMAIEDAAILAPLLMTEPTAEAAFRRYEAMRRTRVARVARLSASNAAIFHMDWPLSAARDLAIRLQGRTGHLKRLDWIYRFDSAPEVETAANRP